MTTRVRLAWFCAAALLAINAPTLSLAQERCGESVNFEDAEIRAVIDEFALRTGKRFVIDPRISGTVTIKSGPNGDLCADEAWELLQAALGVAGYVATPITGESYKVVPAQVGPRSPGEVGEAVQAGDIVTQIVRLQHVDAREAASNLSQIVGERGVVAPVRSSNSIILVDSARNVARLRDVLAEIDKDTSVYRTITLDHASAAEVAEVVSRLAQEISDDSGQRTSINVVPLEATNSILIRAAPSILARLASVVAELDRIGETVTDLSVIALDHADAEEMTPLLREIANSRSAVLGEESPIGRTGSDRASISFHKPTNSIIISGDADIQQTLRNVVSQLDVRRAQVLIEAIIIEVNDRTARELGLQFFLSGDGSENGRVPFTSTNFSSAQPNIFANAGAFLLDSDSFAGGGSSDDDDTTGNTNQDLLATTALNSLLAIDGFALGGAGRLGDGSVFGAILTALQDDDESRVMSFPSVLTLDNQAALLSVGQEIPITTGEAIGDNFSNAFRTVSREEVGVILEVTPKINEANTVTLAVRQETSSIAGQIISDSTDLITNKRVIETTALVDDRDILVLGGLINQEDQILEDKVPLLGDLPALGPLFRTSARSSDRRNLMIFLRPTIIRDKHDARNVTQKKMDYIRARELLSTNKPVSELDRLIEQVTGTIESSPAE
ncbi:MAG: type II secretion system secretin GspD [Pseudomonadota bacterium]